MAMMISVSGAKFETNEANSSSATINEKSFSPLLSKNVT